MIGVKATSTLRENNAATGGSQVCLRASILGLRTSMTSRIEQAVADTLSISRPLGRCIKGR